MGSSTVCPVCFVKFSTRIRLLAQINEQRNRDKRNVTCSHVLRARLVAPIPVDELATANDGDRKLRLLSRKRGHTNPLSIGLAKRPRVGTTLVQQQQLYHAQPPSEKHTLPINALHEQGLPPLKRLRGKSSVDDILQQHVDLGLS